MIIAPAMTDFGIALFLFDLVPSVIILTLALPAPFMVEV
jgi:hypothetical protein